MGDALMNEAQELNKTSEAIIGAAIEVHRQLGPGLRESTYEACLVHELATNGYKVEQQKPIPVKYKDVTLDCGYRLDLLVEDSVVVELKAIDALLPIHEAQLLNYWKLANLRLGLLINFNVKLLRHGIKRLVNGLD